MFRIKFAERKFAKFNQGVFMKLAKLSLAAVLALGFLGAANAADTFEEAFTKGKLAGKPRTRIKKTNARRYTTSS